MFKKLRGRGEAVPLLDLRYLDWTTVFTTAARNLRLERFGPPVVYQLRHGCALHEVSTAFRDVTGVQKKGLLEQLQWATTVQEGCPRPTMAPGRSLFKNFDGRRPVAQNWLRCCGLIAERWPHRDRRNLGQRVRIDGPTRETHSLLECPHVSCVRAPVAGKSSSCADSPAAPRQRPGTVSQNWWPRSLHRWTDFLQRPSTVGCLYSFSSDSGLPAQRPRDHRVHEFLRQPA